MSSAKAIHLVESHSRQAKRPPKSRAFFVPGAARVLVFAAIVLYPVWFTIHYRGVYDPDIWWHMRAGEWVLQNHAVPRANFLSTAGYGKPWVLYSWIFDVTVAELHRIFGLLGPIVIYPVAMCLLIVALLWMLITKLGFALQKRILVMALSVAALAPICSPRPGLCSVFFLAIELFVLANWRHHYSSRLVYLLPVLFTLWANIHVQFVYGLLVMGLFAIEPLIEPRVERFLGIPPTEKQSVGRGLFLFGGCVLATIVNPYFLRLYDVILGLIRQTGQYRYISELQPPSFRSVNGVAELLMILIAWAALVRRRNFRFVPVTFLIIGTFLAFRTVRDVWFGVLAAVFAMGYPPAKAHVESLRARIVIVCCTVLLVIGGVVLIARAHPLSEAELWKDTGEEFPVAAVEFVKNRGFAGPLYNDWNWGGFLIWDLPTIPVYVDSRTNIPGDEILERSIAVWSGASDWASDPVLSQAGLVIANPTNPLTSLLRFDPRFRVAYEDTVAVVFVGAQR